MLYIEAQKRESQRKIRQARKRASSELYADYDGFVKSKYSKMSPAAAIATAIPPAAKQPTVEDVQNEPKRKLLRKLSDNAEAKETPEVKVVSVARRQGWRRKGEKRC